MPSSIRLACASYSGLMSTVRWAPSRSMWTVAAALLRQPCAQLLPSLAAVLRSADEETSVDRHPLLVALSRDDPGGVSISFVDRDRETEVDAAFGLADLLPGRGSVSAVEHAAVVLLPNVIGLPLAQLGRVRVVAPLGLGVRQVVVEQPLVAAAP